MMRGIDGQLIFVDDLDRRDFVLRLRALLPAAGMRCFAWSLMPNHTHLVLRTGDVPLWRVMKRLNGGFARRFNVRHGRKGYLFQDRYRSRLVEEDVDLMVVTRYVHRNPLEACLVDSLERLEGLPWTGYGALIGARAPYEFESVAPILQVFGSSRADARRRIRRWMASEADPGDRYESESSDIGPGTSEPTPNQAVVPGQGRDVAELIEWVCERFGVSAESLRAGRRLRNVARARAVVAYLAVIEGSASTTDVARALGVSPSAISRVLDSGRRLAESEGLARRCADPRCEAHRTDGNPPAGRISQ